jgi:ketosteroid isomerase-like protein
MSINARDSAEALSETIERYNDAWNDHDLDAIMAMHAPDMVFENHTAGESAVGEEARGHIGSIFETWPDIAFTTRRLYVRKGLIVLVKRKDVYPDSVSILRQVGLLD